MEELLTLENARILLAICLGVITIISTGFAIQWRFYRHKIENKEEKYQAKLSLLEAKHEKECTDITSKAAEENKKLRKAIEDELTEKQKSQTDLEGPIIQEVKMVYVKYIHIRASSEPPIYKKYLSRLEKEIDVHSEYHYYRFNKYNRPNNEIIIKDASSGVVDMNILHPWKELEFTDKPSRYNEKSISQRLTESDVYFSSTTYFNGFNEGNEDIGMRMEMDTITARMIADFSSILQLKKMFTKYPDAYRRSKSGQKTKLASLQELSLGVFYLEVNNLKKGESLMLDFHVDWEYLKV